MDYNSVKISFIIVEYHSINEILICYRSILENIPQSLGFEIIISSNSVYSIDEQTNLKETYNTLKWVFNEKNGGFAYAMNQGLKVAIGEVMVIMNPDVRIVQKIDDMFQYLQQQSKVGIIAPQIKNADGIIQDSFREFITPMRFIVRHLRRVLKKDTFKIPVGPVEVDWVIGAFMMMSREAYEVVKGLDEQYFLYCEDMDICKRMQLSGYSVLYYPKAIITYEGTRSARYSKKYACIFFQSLFRYWRKFGIVG